MARARHHQVPKFLLRQFAVNGQVIQLRRGGQRKTVSISNAAVQEHFYSFRNADGVRIPELENYLADEVDGPAAPAIRRIVAGGSTELDLRVAAKFAAFQIVRSPRFRQLDEQIAAHLGPVLAGIDAVELQRREMSDAADLDMSTARQIFDAARAEPPPEYLQSPTSGSYIRNLIWTAERLLAEFDGLDWAVATADTPAFCLGDSPAVFFKPGLPAGGFSGFSVATGGEVRLPLSPRHLLIGSAAHLGSAQLNAPLELVVSTNQMSARECRHMIVLPPGGLAPGDPRPAPQPPALQEPSVKMSFDRSVPAASTSGDVEFPAVSDLWLREVVEASDVDQREQ